MTTEEIKNYINRTGMKDPCHKYSLGTAAGGAIYNLLQTDCTKALLLAFEYGKAKGYRMGKRREAKV